MHRSLLVLLSVLLLGSVCLISCDECHGQDWGNSGQFDFYVVAQSWPANFCASHMSYPGCSNPTNWQQANLTLHGLWPNYNQKESGHYWPQCCSSSYGSTINSQEMNPLLSQLQTVWPSEQNPNPNGNWGSSLWQHEWGKHGTCSGLSPSKYFSAGIMLMQSSALATPPLVASNIGGNVDTSQLESYYNNGSSCGSGSCMVGLTCDNNGNLESVTTCWTPTFNQIVCPAAVINSNRCSGSISIQSFNSNQRVAVY